MNNKSTFFIITTVSDSLPFFKGQLNILKENFDITLVSNPGTHLNEMMKEYDVKGHSVKMKREISLLNDFASLINLMFLFFKYKPTVVHGNTPKASLLSMIAAWIMRVPVRIYYIHGLRYQGVKGAKSKLLIIMEKLTCFFATNIIAVSKGVKDQLKIDGVTSKNIDLIWNGSINGIDLDYFSPEKVQKASIDRIDKDDFVFGFIARIVKDKGIEELVTAFLSLLEKRKQIKLLVLGSFENDDTLDKETVHMIKTHPNIIYLDFQKDIRPYLKLMNVFVLPSYREGFGVVLIEACAMNIPCIATNILGCNEILIDEKTGFLVESRDSKKLFDKMESIVDNPNSIISVGNAGRENVKKKYEQNQLWEKTKEKYLKIISDKNV